MVENIYKEASKQKLRFQFKGNLSLEDLWSLRLTDLDSIYKDLNSKLNLATEESLLTTVSSEDEELSLKIDIIKDVVKTKQEENAKKLNESKNRKEKERIKEALAKKQDEAFDNLTEDELREKLKSYE